MADLCPCGHKHRRNKVACVIAAKAEIWGASVSWSNDPDSFCHQITFTPDELMNWLADNR
jgi:hypothetical protein